MAMVAADDASVAETAATADTGLSDPTVLHTEHLNKIEVNGVEVLMKTTQPGDATHFPSAGNTVRVHYVGKLQQDGMVFDSSREREHPISFVVGSNSGRQQVIDGLDAAVLSMSRGQIAKVTIPPEVSRRTYIHYNNLHRTYKYYRAPRSRTVLPSRSKLRNGGGDESKKRDWPPH